MLRGYARVSTDGQSLEAQLEALKAAGAEKIYAEKMSGAKAHDRQALTKLLREANPGDTIVVTRLDRLARSTRDLLNMLDRLSRDAIGFKSLRETSIDTTTPQGRLVINILASISEFERELIRGRMIEPQTRRDQGRKIRPQVQAQPFPAARGISAALSWRNTGRHRPHLQCRSRHHLPPAEAGGGIYQPFRAQRGRRRVTPNK
jgi:DNA invertase Pin-like site-specific DNA recombinase